MHKTVIALYDNVDDAQQAIRDMVDSGVPRDQISLVAGDRTGQLHEGMGETSGAAQGAGVGAGVGAALGGIGGLLVGLGALTIPGIGPVLAAGPLAAALGGVAGAGAGAVVGGAAGGIIGSLTDLGVSEDQAGNFAEGIRRGGTLITVRTDDVTTDRAKDVMNRHHPIDVNERANQWRQTGWAGFDPNSPVFDPNETQGPVSTTNIGHAGPAEITDTGQFTSTGDVGTVGTAMDEDEMGNTGMGSAAMGDTGFRVETFDYFETDFRNHYANSFGDRGYTYNQYMPAYRYGYDLASNPRYTQNDWSVVEPEARQYWEDRHPGTWEQFKDAVHHAWMSVRNAISR